MTTNSFSIFDYWQAVDACKDVYYEDKHALDDYLMRKQKEALCALVKKVIRNELSERDQLLVRLHWYKGKSVPEIAQIIGADRSSVFRRMEKIEDILFDKLKYAMEYRFGESVAADAKRVIKTEIPPALRTDGINSIGARLKYLRAASFYSPQQVCDKVGISMQRLTQLEENGKEMTMPELKKFCSLFDVSTDLLIFGKGLPLDGSVVA